MKNWSKTTSFKLIMIANMTQVTLDQALAMGIAHHRAGRLQEAEAIYRQILQSQANQPDALHLLGILACQAERFDLAVDLIQQSIAAEPNSADAYSNLGNALQSLGRRGEAIAAYYQSLKLNPSSAGTHNNLACALRDAGRIEDALAEFQHAISLLPDYAEAYNNLANTLRDAGRLDEAIDWLHRSIALASDVPDIRITLGAVLEQQGNYAQAINCYQDALNLNPNSIVAHVDLGIALLRNGDFATGLNEYEWRLKQRSIREKLAQLSNKPRWSGQPLQGQPILVFPEQGFGDIIHFIRFLPDVAARGGRVIFQCPPELRRLLADFADVARFISTEDELPEFDTYCLLLSLPHILQLRLEKLPQSVAYIRANPEIVQHWRNKIAALPVGQIPQDSMPLRVGLAWSGRLDHRDNRNRSIPFSELAELIESPHATFFSLQKSAPADSTLLASGEALIDWTTELHDFADTAGLIENLDLVITADTAVAHLAGAMGKPTWLLLPFVPDWRWMLNRDDSPWYPTMKLFRQPAIGDWQSVIQHVGDELAQY